MMTVLFDVNESKLRNDFLDTVLIECVVHLPEGTKSLWGKMTAHDMIEHLIWTFECSIGTIEVPCRTPETLLERAKRFLFDNRPTPQNFINPLLGDDPLPHRYPEFTEAKSALLEKIHAFHRYFNDHPEAVHTHPIFGLLGGEEWHRAHFKHCYHHLLQFGQLNQGGTETS